jgi:hypothetical protein
MNSSLTKKQFLEAIKEDLPRIYALMDKFHSCKGSSQMTCCGDWRCEPCHVTHIREVHGRHALHAYWRTTNLRPIWGRKVGKKEEKIPTSEMLPLEDNSSEEAIINSMTKEDWDRFWEQQQE